MDNTRKAALITAALGLIPLTVAFVIDYRNEKRRQDEALDEEIRDLLDPSYRKRD